MFSPPAPIRQQVQHFIRAEKKNDLKPAQQFLTFQVIAK